MQRSLLALVLFAAPLAGGVAGDVEFSQSTSSVAVYDFLEVSVRVAAPAAGNPFTGLVVTGSFGLAGAAERTKVDGFCDSADGSLFRIRFMPSQPGDYTYSVT